MEKCILYDINGETHYLNLTKDQIEFWKWLVKNYLIDEENNLIKLNNLDFQSIGEKD